MSRMRRFLVAALVAVPTGLLFAKSARRPAGPVRRFHAVTGLRREKADYYFKLHAAAWPGVLKMIQRANIRNFSIAVKEIEDKLYLLSYFEYIGKDYEADMKKVAADPETQRCGQQTEPCQLPLPEAKAEGVIWADA